MRARPSPAAGRDAGFTLLEVMLAMSLMAGIMAAVYMLLFGVLKQQRFIEPQVLQSRIGPVLLDQVERDVRQLFAFNVGHQPVLRGENHRIAGLDADKLHLVAYTPSFASVSHDDKLVYSNVNEVGYVLTRRPPPFDEFLILWRREDYFVDDEPLEDGYGTPLYRRILRFDITYYKERGEDAEEYEEWDPDDEPGLPSAMEVTIELEVEPRAQDDVLSAEQLERRRYTYRRFINLPTDGEYAMAIRAAIPKSPEEDGDGPIGGPGSQVDTDGEQGPGNIGGGGGGGGIDFSGGGTAGQAGGGGR